MKRVVGRKMMRDQTELYSISRIEPTPVDIASNPNMRGGGFRFHWASDIIDALQSEGISCMDYLDVGTYNGVMAFMVSNKPTASVSGTIRVDAVEAHKQSFEAANTTAMELVKLGRHINIYNVRFEDYETDKMYDMISAFEVIEHTNDPLFCIEKMYDLLHIGGHLLLTVPEQHSVFGLCDKNELHYWTSSVQSLVFVFNDDRKWRIKQIIEQGGLIHLFVQKRTYME